MIINSLFHKFYFLCIWFITTVHIVIQRVTAQTVQKLGYGQENRGSIPGRGDDGIFLVFATASRPALGKTQYLIQWLSGALSRGGKEVGA
jgi:hypothetical protein